MIATGKIKGLFCTKREEERWKREKKLKVNKSS